MPFCLLPALCKISVTLWRPVIYVRYFSELFICCIHRLDPNLYYNQVNHECFLHHVHTIFYCCFIFADTDSSLSYSRLSTEPISHSSSASRLKRSLWNLNVGKQVPAKKPKTKPKNKQEVEKEWLLLGEPTSPCPQREPKDVESTILSDGEPPVRRTSVLGHSFHLLYKVCFYSLRTLSIRINLIIQIRTLLPTLMPL